jgi:thioredoxin 1
MTYSELINDKTPVLVDFSADWCGPCKAMHPVLQKVAANIGDSARIIKIDVDKNRTLASKLGVMGVPTFILYKEGEILWRRSGMQSETELTKVISEAASSN